MSTQQASVTEQDVPKQFSVNLNMTFLHSRVAYLLCAAFEGGSGYWAALNKDDSVKPSREFNPWDGQSLDYCPWYISWPFSKGGSVAIVDVEDSEEVFQLDREKLVQGLTTMATKYPHHFRNFIDENEDAETGDVFLQCCFFGEIVYG